MPDIYGLKFMETIRISNDLESYTCIQRVPGGWIFTEYLESNIDGSNDINTNISSVFVPYNDEFKTKEEFTMADPELM